MTRYREILRMHKQNISQRAIASTLECSRNTVSRVIQKAGEVNLQWFDVENMSDQDIEKQLFPELKSRVIYFEPDFEYVHKELARSGVTLSLLWLEYSDICRDNNLFPYKYSHFCKLYNDFTLKTKATMRIVHKPGEKIEVDWAGKTLALKDNNNGSNIKVYVFAATLPYSGYTYVEGFLSMNSENWIQAHINAFNYFNGVSKIIVPDNLKAGVTEVNRFSPVINRAYADMAAFYDTAIIPARVRKPKDKASVEGSVGDITSFIIAALRDITFFYLYDLNEAISHKLQEFNKKPFQKKDGSRESVFMNEEQSMLMPLPFKAYEPAIWSKSIVPYNYHVCVEKNYYSIPYEYIKHEIEIRITSKMIEFFNNGDRIACHIRKIGVSGQYQTNSEHMPVKHQKYLEWNTENILAWSSKVGHNTRLVAEGIISSFKVEQQSYRTCMALLKYADTYSPEQLEKACERAFYYGGNPGIKTVRAILNNGSKQCVTEDESMESSAKNDSEHGIVRGSAYYGRKNK